MRSSIVCTTPLIAKEGEQTTLACGEETTVQGRGGQTSGNDVNWKT